MPRGIQCGSEKVVHGTVDHQEATALVLFEVLGAHKKRACVADNPAARFEEQRQRTLADTFGDAASVGLQVRRRLVCVAHAEAATEVEVIDGNALRRERVDKLEEPVEGL